MSRATRLRWLLLAMAAGSAFSATARADAPPLTPAAQQGLIRAMRYWAMEPFGGGASGGHYTQASEGDHIRLDMPFKFAAAQVASGHVIVHAKPLDAGRWSLDGVPLTASLTILPTPGAPGLRGQNQAFEVQNLVSHSVIDPTLATVSSFDVTAAGLAGALQAPGIAAVALTTGRFASHTVWQPTGGMRVDATGSMNVGNISVQPLGGGGYRAAMRRLTADTRFHDFAPDRQAEAGRVLALLAPGGDAALPTGAQRPTATQRALLHAALEAMRTAYGSVESAAGFEGFGINVLGHEVGFDKAAFGFSVSQPDGRADMKLRVALDGIGRATPEAGLLPQRFVLALHFAGAPANDLFAAMAGAIDAGEVKSTDLTGTFIAALAKLPLATSLDQLSFSMGPSAWSASGTLHSNGPGEVAGDALVRATGLDALIRMAGSDQRMRLVAPELIFLKGLGRQNGDTTIWKLVYADHKATVNGAALPTFNPQHHT